MRVLLLLALLGLAACQSVTVQPTVNQQLLPAAWAIDGKLGYRGTESGSATFTWQRQADENRITLSGPFGSYATRLSGTASYLTIEADDTRISGSSEAVMQAQLGWSTPLDSWVYWLNGRPDPNFSVTHYHRNDTGISFTQNAVQVELSRFRPVQRYALPHRIVVTRGDERLSLIIANWELGEDHDD